MSSYILTSVLILSLISFIFTEGYLDTKRDKRDCYSSRLSNKSKEKPCIGFIQENSIEFLVQYIYLIYTRLIVHTIWVLAYSKNYIYYILFIYNII